MPEIHINGINIKFPFTPYDLQKDYMSKVIECIENSANGGNSKKNQHYCKQYY